MGSSGSKIIKSSKIDKEMVEAKSKPTTLKDGIGGNLDASDINSLEEARAEIKRLRLIAKDALKERDDLERRLSQTTTGSMITTATASTRRINEARAAVMAPSGNDKAYVKTTIPKSNQVRNLIYHSIKRNMLFRACSEEELQDLIDAFDYTGGLPFEKLEGMAFNNDGFWIVNDNDGVDDNSGEIQLISLFSDSELIMSSVE